MRNWELVLPAGISRPLILPLWAKMNQEYQQPTFLPQKETQHPKSHRHNLKQRFVQTSVISAWRWQYKNTAEMLGVVVRAPAEVADSEIKHILSLLTRVGVRCGPSWWFQTPARHQSCTTQPWEWDFSTYREFLLPPSVPEETLILFISNEGFNEQVPI